MKKLFVLAAAVIAVTGCFQPSAPSLKYTTDVLPVYEGDVYYYVDVKTGRKAVGSGEYNAASYFFDGVARVMNEGEERYTLIGKDFKPISSTEYADVTDFSDGIAFAVRPQGHIEAIDKTGKVLFELDEYDRVYSAKYGYAVVEKNGKSGLIDKTGKVVLEPEYESLRLNKKCIIASREKSDGTTRYGVLDYTGKEVIPFSYDNIMDNEILSAKGLFIVEKNDKTGVINEKDEDVIAREWSGIYFMPQSAKFLASKYDSSREVYKIVVLNRKGEEVSDRISVGNFNVGQNGLISATRSSDADGEWGILNEKLEWVISPKWNSLSDFKDCGLAIAYCGDNETCVVNDKGEVVIRPVYSSIYYLGNGLFNLCGDGEESIGNAKGETVVRSNTWVFSLPSENNYVEDQYVDVNRIAQDIVAFIARLAVDSPSIEAYETEFEADLRTYGWETLDYLEHRFAGGSLRAECDWDYNSYYDRVYSINSFQANLYTLNAADNCCDQVWAAVVNLMGGDIQNLQIPGMPSNWRVSARAENDYFYLTVDPRSRIR